MAKNTPKTLTVILLLTLAALSVAAVLVPAADSQATGEQNPGGISSDQTEPPDGDVAPDVTPDDEPQEVPEPFSPIPPEASAFYTYTQTLWAEGGV